MADRSTQPLETAIDKGFHKFTEGLRQGDVEGIISTLKGNQDNNRKDRLILTTLETNAQERAYQDWKKLVDTVVPLIEEDDVQVSLERVTDILGRDFIHSDDLVRFLNKLKDPSTRRAFTQWYEEALGGQGSWPEDYIFYEARRLLSRESSTEPTEEKSRSFQKLQGFHKFTEGLRQAEVYAIISILKGHQDNNKKDRLILTTLETNAQERAYQDWKKLVSLERVKDILGRDFIHNDDLVRLLNKLKDPSTRRAFTQWCEEALGGQGSWPEDYIFYEARRLLSRKSSTEPTEEKSLSQLDGFVVVPPYTTTRESSLRQSSNDQSRAPQRPLEDEGRPKLLKDGGIGMDLVENDLTKHPSNCQEEEVQKPLQLLLERNEGKGFYKFTKGLHHADVEAIISILKGNQGSNRKDKVILAILETDAQKRAYQDWKTLVSLERVKDILGRDFIHSTRQEEEIQKPPQLLLERKEGEPVTEDFSKLRKMVDTLSFHQATFSKATIACSRECESIFTQLKDNYEQFAAETMYKNTPKGETQVNNDIDRLLAVMKVKQAEQEELKQERWQILDLCAEIRIHIKYKSSTMPADSFRMYLIRLIVESRQGQGGLFPEIVKDLQSVLEYYDRKVGEVGDAVEEKARNILTDYEIEGKLLDLRRLKHYGEVVDKAIVKGGIAVPPTR